MRYLLFLFLLVSFASYSQKSYSFNYLVEYNFKSYIERLQDEMIFYLTNSKDNSYYAKLESLDSLNFSLEFIVQDRLWSKTVLPKQGFYKAQFITMSCEGDLTYRNDFKFRTKEYQFEVLPDTLFENSFLKNYKLKYTGRRKRKKSFPVGTNLYIIENSTDFHLPILTHSTAFEEWKEERNIPNGIFKEKIFYDFNNKMQYRYILKNYYELDKAIIIPNECFEE